MARKVDGSFLIYKKEVQESNVKMLKMVSFHGAITCFCLLLGSFVVPGIADSRLVYFIWTVSSVLTLCLCRLRRAWVTKHAIMLVYLYTAAILLAAMYNGTHLYMQGSATTAVCMIAILPFVLFDKPWRACLYQAAMGLLLCGVTIWIKSGETALVDCLNTIGFTLLACIMGNAQIKMKLADIAAKVAIIQQRDTDVLTGVSSRQAAEKQITSYLLHETSLAAMMIIDVDHFKNINDTLGHMQGDETLIDVAKIIRGMFRSSDCVARWGGDEFLVFVKNIPDVKWLQSQSERLVRSLQKDYEVQGAVCSISASVGIALYTGKEDFDTLYRNADVALYRVKEQGRNGWKIFSNR